MAGRHLGTGDWALRGALALALLGSAPCHGQWLTEPTPPAPPVEAWRPSKLDPTGPQALLHLLLTRSFRDLDQALDLAAKRPRRRDGGERISDHFVALVQGLPDDVLDVLDAWCAARPDSSWAFLTRGSFLHCEYFRDIGWAHDAGRRHSGQGARDKARRSIQDLQRANRLGTVSALASADLIELSKVFPEAGEAEALLRDAAARDPDSREPYIQMAFRAVPIWGGTISGMRALCRGFARKNPALRPLLAWAEDHAMRAMSKEQKKRYLTPERLRELEELEETLTREFPGDGELAESFREIWLHAGEIERAYRVLERAAAEGSSHAVRTLKSKLHGRVQPGDLERTFRALQAFSTGEQPHAGYFLAQCYHWGFGTDVDIPRAREIYRRCAEYGGHRAMRKLGDLMGAESPGEPDYAAAAEWYERAIAFGSWTAKLELGLLYYDGKGVPQDRARAFRLISSAAEHPWPIGGLHLARFYEEGVVVEKDMARARQFYDRVRARDFVEALYKVGWGFVGWPPKPKAGCWGVRWVKQAALEHRHGQAAYRLYRWFDGEGGMLPGTPDDVETRRWAVLGAELGVPLMEYQAGRRLLRGIGGPPEPERGQGFLEACRARKEWEDWPRCALELGEAFCDGRGVEASRSRCNQLLREAADAGNADALQALRTRGLLR